MKLPAFIQKLLPAKDLKPKGEICTLDFPTAPAPKDEEPKKRPTKLDPDDISTIEMIHTKTDDKHYWFKLKDTETGFHETWGFPKEWFAQEQSALDKTIAKEKREIRKKSVNVHRYGVPT